METNGESSDRINAADGLDAIAAARRAVRDQPWPTWLYPTNALLLGAITLTSLLDSSMMASLLILVLGVGVALSPSALSKQVAALVDAGYVTQTRAEHDSRHIWLSLTKAGKRAYRGHVKALQEIVASSSIAF